MEDYRRRVGLAHVKANCSAKIWVFIYESREKVGSTDTIQQLTMNYNLRGGNKCFKVTVVYVRCSALKRLELWGDLEEITCHNQGP